MNRDKDYLDHILECIERIERYIEGDPTLIFRESMAEDAVMRNLQIIAESTKRLSTDIKNAHQEVPWRQIKAMRNVLVHDYLNVRLSIIATIIREDLPALKKAIQIMLNDFDPNLFTQK
jgi:uncharacterized protein with HEPN domain